MKIGQLALAALTVGLLTSTGAVISSGAALADPTNPDFVPPEITLPYPAQYQQPAQPAAAQPGQAVPGQAVPGQNAAGGNLGFQVPGQMANMVQQAGQQMTTPGIQGQGMNPFLMKGADRLRQPPGTQMPTRGYNPNTAPQGQQYPGAPTVGSGAYGQQNQAGQQPQQPQAQLSTSAQLAGQNQTNPTAVIATSKGNITIMLFREYAPQTVNAFLQMIHEGFYNGLTFHRVEPGFVIQGGCPRGDGTGNYINKMTNQPRFLPLETSAKVSHNAAGVVAMAHQPGNVNTNSCQFYITLKPQPRLDGQYTVFGGVTSGMEVVNMIQKYDKIISITASE